MEREEFSALAEKYMDLVWRVALNCVGHPADADDDQTRRFFARMRELLAAAAARGYENAQMDILSMGMSGDYAAAIAEGATIVRIGTAIYGARDYSKK